MCCRSRAVWRLKNVGVKIHRVASRDTADTCVSHRVEGNIHLELFKRERNIYQLAQLIPQKRRPVGEYVHLLKGPEDAEEHDLDLKENQIVNRATSQRYAVLDDVAIFTDRDVCDEEWKGKNEQFLNYNKSLGPYTLMNSTPLINYLSSETGLGKLQHIRVADVGGGTGHAQCSFFRHPETIEYFLVDPNLRLLHDQFVRIYPGLSEHPMAHILAYAERLPFKSATFDLVMSLSSIDHFGDYKRFLGEGYRILKPAGSIFIAGHLHHEAVDPRPQSASLFQKIFSETFWERLARYLYYRKYKVGRDDHTQHFATTQPIEEALLSSGFCIERSHTVMGLFYLTAKK